MDDQLCTLKTLFRMLYRRLNPSWKHVDSVVILLNNLYSEPALPQHMINVCKVRTMKPMIGLGEQLRVSASTEQDR